MGGNKARRDSDLWNRWPLCFDRSSLCLEINCLALGDKQNLNCLHVCISDERKIAHVRVK